MSTKLSGLFDHNRAWAARMEAERPGFFTKLTTQQNPKYMWIGCSDSRVPANQITGLEPGEVFVHRNVANLVVHSDLNALSTIQFAVERLNVAHVMVVGHYGCSGVRVQDVRDRHRDIMDVIPEHGRAAALSELNVVEQVVNVAQTTVMQDAWARGQDVTLHGWVYGLQDGLLQDLHMTVSGTDSLDALYREALAGIRLTPRHGTA